MSSRERSLAPLALLSFVVALTLRVVVALRTHALYPDGAVELTMAEAFLAGRADVALDARFHPLTAVLTALLSGLTGLGVETAATAVVVVCSALVAPCCALVGARLCPESPRRAALAAGLLAAAHPALTRTGGQVLAYGVAHAALALSLLCLTRAVMNHTNQANRTWPWAAAAGAAVGLGYLARMDALATGAGLGLGLAAFSLRSKRWAGFGAFALGLLLLMSPYVIALRVHTGAWQLSSKKSVGSVVALPPTPTPGPVASAPSLADLIRTEAGAGPPVPGPAPAQAAWFALEKALGAAHPLLVVLLGLGLALAFRAGRWPPGWGLSLLAAAAFVATHALLKLNWGYTSRLHQSALGVLVVPWAARGLVHLSARRPHLTPLLLALALAVLLPKALAPRLPHKALQREVANVLRRAGASAVCGTGEVRPIAWRARSTFRELPPGPAPDALAAARREGVTHLVVYLRRRGRRPRALERALARAGAHPLAPPLVSQRGQISYTWIVFRL